MPSSYPSAAPKALLLDAGNTVVFIDHDLIAELLRGHGLSADAAVLRRTQAAANQHYTATLHGGGPHEDAWRAFMNGWLGAAGIAQGSAAASACTMLRSHHDQFNLWRRVPEGLVAAVERVRQAGIAVGIVSNSEGKLHRLMRRLDLDAAFDLIIDSAKEGVRKPDAAIFHRACQRLGVEPWAAVYAGDIPEVDVEGALGAGLQAVLIDDLDLYVDFALAPRFRSVAALCQHILDGNMTCQPPPAQDLRLGWQL